MTKSNDLQAVMKPQFGPALNKLKNLMNQSGKVFLIGAGCSRYAGLPLMEELTCQVLESDDIEPRTKKILEDTKDNFSKSDSSNIEDYLSEIVDHLAIVERREDRGIDNNTISIGDGAYTKEELRDSIEEVKYTIAKILECSDRKIKVDAHRRFIRAVHRPIRPGKVNYIDHIDYICLNYDTLLEDALALERIPFSDGLDGGVTGWWNPATFEDKNISTCVFKLHGSINWCEFDNDPFPRRVAGNIDLEPDGSQKILIWPASTKYREIQKDPYAQLAIRARESLKPVQNSHKVLFILGYSFRDSHINSEIDRALRESNGRLTVVIFTSEDEPAGEIQKWQEDPYVREQVIVYANHGFFHADEEVLSKDADLLWWDFTNFATLLGGGI